MSEKFTEAGKWTDNEYSTTFAIPVSYRQLDDAGISLNSSFDDDAGADDGYGEIVITCANCMNDEWRISQQYSVYVLQTTLQNTTPHWVNAEYVFNDHCAGHKNRQEYSRQQSKLEALFNEMADSSLMEQIDQDYESWEELAEEFEANS